MKNRTTVERRSDREVVTSRVIDAPARIVFQAWTRADLFARWWIPRSIGMTLVSCEMDIRTGGTYKLVLRVKDSEPMAFHGKYVEVTPPSRIVWTNEEGPEVSITTVTFEESNGKTRVAVHELHPSKEALDASGAHEGLVEQLDQLEELLGELELGA